jgi:tetratricopeptide (TPR) repeat protein
MAETTLRAYVKEIDALIENEQLDEAIAHSRHILEQHPKHLETYRLLGKAYLEAKRYGDAADIFQRVLSAVPDDFVAHIGMAIVREDEGNLDSAIWHMERAFETNPANPAIQQELRRLIGRRDGLEPHKVRMTRGALGRMYAHGELFPQAIAELRAALEEDPDRPDLQVLLASMYWRTDQHAEAADICNLILENLPYCRDANMIMASILQEAGKTDEAVVYHRRLVSLNPYAAFVERAHLDPKTVDAKAVRIDRFEWKPGQAMPVSEVAPSDWAASLGVELDEEPSIESEPSAKPSWLEELEPAEEEAPPEPSEVAPREVEPMAGEEQEADDQIPDWMREAGWQESSGEVQESPISFSDEELSAAEAGMVGEEAEEGELAPAEIPGWLQDIAPSESEAEPSMEPPIDQEEGAFEAADEGPPSWMSEGAEPEEEPAPSMEAVHLESAPADEIEPPDYATPEEEPEVDFTEPVTEPPGDTHELPTWLDDESPGATTTIVTWLDDRELDRPVPEPEQPVIEEAPASQEGQMESEEPEAEETDLPDWLNSIGEAAAEEIQEEPEAARPEEPHGWLAGVAEVAAQQDLTPISEEQPPIEEPAKEATEMDEEAPEWLSSISESRGDEPEEMEEAAPDWLEGIGEPEKETLGEARPASADAPEWLQGIAEPGAHAEEAAPVEPEREGAPDWLGSIGEEPTSPLPEETPEAEEEAPDWLLAAEEVAEPEPSAAAELEEAPDWLAGIEEPALEESDQAFPVRLDAEISEEPEPTSFESPPVGAAEVQQPEPPEAPIPGVPESAHEGMAADEFEDDDVMDWLEDLAARQEEVEAQVVERRTEEPEIAEEEPILEERGLPEEADESLEWLEILASKRGIDMEVETPTPERAVPEEPVTPLQEVKPLPEAPTPEPEEVMAEPQLEVEGPEVAEVVEVPEEEAPAWLMEEEAVEPQAPPTPEAELFPSAPEPEPEEPVIEPPVIEEAIPDWLLETSEEAPSPEPQWSEAETTPPVPGPVIPEASPTPAAFEEEAAPVAPEGPSVEPPSVEIEPEEAPVPEPSIQEAPPEPPMREPVPEVFEPAEAIPEEELDIFPEPELKEQPVVEEPEPAVELEPVPVRAAETAPKPKAAEPDAATLLEDARRALAREDLDEATSHYAALIKRSESLQGIIEDLNTALEREANQPALWQILGDAYMKDGQVAEAVKAYQRGMESV